MKAAKLREQSAEELRQMVGDMSREVADLRIKKGVGESTVQPLRRRTLRRDVARVKTVLREKERAEAKKHE